MRMDLECILCMGLGLELQNSVAMKKDHFNDRLPQILAMNLYPSMK